MTDRPDVKLSFDPPGPRFMISEQAVMPKITVTAVMENIIADRHALQRFDWTVKLTFSEPRCAHANGKTTSHPNIVVSTKNNSLVIPFTLIRGGKLTVAVVAAIADKQWSASRADLSIGGTNPTPANLSAAVLGAPDAFKRLMRLESQLRQFREANCPLFSADNLGGVGLCQLTPPSSDDQIWNWRENVAGGLALYHEKETNAKAHPRNVRTGKIFKAQVVAYNASIAAAATRAHTAPAKPIVVAVPDYTPAQLELDTIRAFNGYAGGLHEYRLKTDADGLLVVTLDPTATTGTAEWERISAADRTAYYDDIALPLKKRGDPNYVDDVLKQPVF